MAMSHHAVGVGSSLLSEIESFTPPACSDAFLPDRWVASSLLQKAIRRGHASLALTAAKYLSAQSAEASWRRLDVIGWEDVSLGDLEGLLGIATLSSSKQLRRKLGGDEHTLAWAVSRLASASKNRITDDIVTVLEHGETSRKLVGEVLSLRPVELRCMVRCRHRCILRRSVAVWILMGTARFPSASLPMRSGSADDYFAMWGSAEVPAALTRLGPALSRKTNTIFPALIAALWEDWQADSPDAIAQEQLVWNESIKGIPAYVFDGHTAKGGRYLRRLAETDTELAWWLHAHLRPELHGAALKKFCFRTISMQCSVRQAWAPAEEMRNRAASVGFALPSEVFCEGLSVFRSAIDRYPVWEIG